MNETNESTLWNESETDIEQLFLERKYNAISEYAAENTKLLLRKWKNETYEDLEKSVRYGNFIMDYLSAGIKKNTKDRALFDLGGLFRAVKIFASLLYNLGINHRLEERKEKELSGIKHLESIIYALEAHGSMTHTELGEYLGMNPSTLTEAMKKIVETGTIQAISSGKYKLYSLTDNGIILGKQLRRSSTAKEAKKHIGVLRMILEETPEGEKKKHIIEEISSLLPANGNMLFYTGDHVRYYPNGVLGRKDYIDSIITLMVQEGDQKILFAKPDDAYISEMKGQYHPSIKSSYFSKNDYSKSINSLLSYAI